MCTKGTLVKYTHNHRKTDFIPFKKKTGIRSDVDVGQVGSWNVDLIDTLSSNLDPRTFPFHS